jgi:ATP-dependent Lon protease
MDISQALFVLTGLGLEALPPEVASRVFAVEWAGYARSRKVEIASTSILPKLLERYSLANDDFQIVDEGIASVIDEYTNDSGLEQVEIVLDVLCRKATAAKSADKPLAEPIDSEAIQRLLGKPRRYLDQIQALVRPGMAKGVALSAEGAVVEVVEIAVVPGAEGFGIVGSANDAVGKMIDLSYHYIRSRMTEMDISARQLYEYAYRVNLPGYPNEVSTQSLGLAVVVAFLSQIRDRLVDPELALVGEMTLNGRVVGGPGLQHMLLAAHRNGIRRLVIPGECREDLDDLPADLTNDIAIIQVDDAEQAIRIALE